MSTMTLGEIAYREFIEGKQAPSFWELSDEEIGKWQRTAMRVAASVGRADAIEGEVIE